MQTPDAPDPDRDRVALEAAETELLELERELARIDGTDDDADADG